MSRRRPRSRWQQPTTGPLAAFEFSSTHFERRGTFGRSLKVLSPRAVRVGGTCGSEVPIFILRRGSDAAITLAVDGLPMGASASLDPIPVGGSTSTLYITNTGATGHYVLRITGQADGVPVLGTELAVDLP